MARLRKLRIAIGLALLGAVGLTSAMATFSGSPPVETFDGNPATPQAFLDAEWDVQVHTRDRGTWFTLEAINAQHGADCAGPPASHVNTSYEGSVFQCRDHVMTALNSTSYGVIYLTPNQIFDFSGGGSLTFDLSTERMSVRDWWDVLITPYENNLALPLLSNLSQGTDLQGPPLNTIHIGTDNGEGSPRLSTVVNGNEWSGPDWIEPANSGISGTVNQAATRQTFKLTIGNGRMKFERLASATAPGLVFWDVAATVPFTSGIVQFGHHSYNPAKDGAGTAGTWHWDNISFSASTPFTMIKADRRYTQGGTVNFASPAPANAYLRFAGICKVSINGQVVTRAADYDRWGVGYKPEHMSSYFVPIAEGTQSIDVSFSNDGWYETGHGCIAKDFSIWSLNSSTSQTVVPEITSTPTPTSTPSATNTNTPTPVSSTATPTSTATSTPVPPTATPTPARCRVQVRNASNTGWTYSVTRGSYEGTLVDGECRR